VTDVIFNLFVEVHPCKSPLALLLDGNYFLIPSCVGKYTHWHILPNVLADSNTISLCSALYNCHSWRVDIALCGWCPEHIPKFERYSSCLGGIRQFQCPYQAVYIDLSAITVNLSKNWWSNNNDNLALTIVFPQLDGGFLIAKDISSTIDLVKSRTSEFVNSFNIEMWCNGTAVCDVSRAG
jgi:hypothetical protein